MAIKTEKTPLIAFVLDFETGGKNPNKCGCTQVSIYAIRLDTFEIIGKYTSYILPYTHKAEDGTGKKRKVLKEKYEQEEPLMEYNEIMMKEVTGITMDMLKEQGKPLETVVQEMLQFFADNTPEKPEANIRPVLVGQNIVFDEAFLCQIFEMTGLMKELKAIFRGDVDYYGHWHPTMIDTLLLGQLALCHIPNVYSYKLEIMCETLGIELNDAHDAEADVFATTSVMTVLAQRMRNMGESSNSILANLQPEKTRKHWKI